jgi:hypothetical protein
MAIEKSNPRQVVSSWLAQLNPQDPGLLLDANGQCQLVSDMVANNCVVFVPTAESESFYLFQDICQLPERLDAAAYEGFLALNLLGVDTRGGTLGLEKETRNLVFSFSRGIADTDVRIFCTVLENFLDTADILRERLAQLLRTDTKKIRPQTGTAHRLLRK